MKELKQFALVQPTPNQEKTLKQTRGQPKKVFLKTK